MPVKFDVEVDYKIPLSSISAQLSKKVEELNEKSVTVGVHDDAGTSFRPALDASTVTMLTDLGYEIPWYFLTDTTTAIVNYAIYNEFGMEGVPARPFMRVTYETYRKFFEGLVKDQIYLVVEANKNSDEALRRLGEIYKSFIRRTLDKSREYFRPNSTFTILRKGSSKPLYEQGDLYNSISYKVRG